MSRSRPQANAYWLGRIPYHEAWELQRSLVDGVRARRLPDTLLLLEHPHVFTIGRAGSGEHLLWDEVERARRQVEVIWSDRGGDATYHGPGQLVGYPVLDVRRLGHDILSYLRALEGSIIAYLATLGIESAPGGPGLTGVWSAGDKVAAIGVKMNHSVVSHGFALNLTTDLEYFDGIVPCGLVGKRATSVERLGAGCIETEAAAHAYTACFADAFGLDVSWGKAKDLAGLPRAEPVQSLSVVGR